MATSATQEISFIDDILNKNLLESASKNNLITSKYRNEKIFSDVIAAVVNGDWLNPIFSTDYQYYALKAVEHDHLTPAQFSTTMIFRDVIENHPSAEAIEIFPIFDDKKRLYQKSCQIINSTFEKLTLSQKGSSYFDEEQLKLFYKNLRSMDRSQHYFILIPKDLEYTTDGHLSSVVKTIIDDIRYKLKINLFLFTEDFQGHPVRMIPSFGMKQAFLNTFFSHQPIFLSPMIGISSLDSLYENIQVQITPDAIPFGNIIKLPEMADSLFCHGSWNFNYHDFYHALIKGYIPNLHRILFGELFRIFQHEASICSSSFEKKYLSILAEKCIDLEMYSYRATDENFTKALRPHHSFTLLEQINLLPNAVLNELVRNELRSHDELEVLTNFFLSEIKKTKILHRIASILKKNESILKKHEDKYKESLSELNKQINLSRLVVDFSSGSKDSIEESLTELITS